VASPIIRLNAATHGEHKFGSNPLVGTSQETVWSGGGLFPWSTTWDSGPKECFIYSDSVNDTEGDFGAETVRVFGLGGDGILKEVDVSLSATFHVSIGTWSMVHRAHVLTCGSFDANVGNIFIDYNDATTVAEILASEGQTLMSVYKVPANMQGWLQSMYADFTSGDSGTARLYTRKEHGHSWRLRGILSVSGGQEEFRVFPPSMVAIRPGEMIDMRATGGNASGQRVNGGFNLVLSTMGTRPNR
jgi:hypothetical protein